MTTQLNISEYIEQYERLHPPRKTQSIPSDPSKKWWFWRSSDPQIECVERCKYNLYRTAMMESKVIDPADGNNITHEQRVIHARYAALQSECLDICKSAMSEM